MAFICLPLPLLLISCYLFLFPKRREQTNQRPHPPRNQTGNIHTPAPPYPRNVEGSEQHLRNRQGSSNLEGSGQHIQDEHCSGQLVQDEHCSTNEEGSGQDEHSFTSLEKPEQHSGEGHSSTNVIGSEHQTVHKSSRSKHSNNREKKDSLNRRSQSPTKQNS